MTARILIKIGGRAFEGESGFRDLAAALQSIGDVEIIIVHGGGVEISQALKNADRPTRFIDGIRVTLAEDVRIVESVLSNTINHRIAAWLTANGVPCSSMSGKTRQLFIAEPLIRKGQDLGYVGRIKRVNAAVVLESLSAGKLPVVSPISADEKGESYNVNADSAAAALAAAVRCTDLVFITDVPGVLVDDVIRPSLSIRQAETLIADGIIKGGMVAKMEAAFDALRQNVPRVHIIQWRGPESLCNIVRGNLETGTIIKTT